MNAVISFLFLVMTLTRWPSMVQTSSPEAEVSGLGRRPLVLSPANRKQIEEVIDWTMRCSHVTGLALSIVTLREGALMERGFGWANISTGSKVTEHTLFPIASTTKAFTSTLLAVLMGKHKNLKSSFDWSTPIRKVLGDSFALYDNLLTSHVTLEDLLAHRTGIPDYFLLLMAPYPERITRQQLVHSLRYHKPEHPFRTHFLYNNHMYVLAGHVAEVLEGKTWEELIRNRLLEPLAMKSTLFVSEALNATFRNKMAASYGFADGKFHPVDIDFLHQVDVAGPAGSIVSTAHDMSKWMAFHLSGGRPVSSEERPIQLDTDRLMDTYTERNVASARQLNDRDLVRPKSPVSDVHIAYDLGWMTNYYRGYKRIWHSGSISTYKSQLWLYPDMEMGIFATSNSFSSSATQGLNRIMHFISDVLLGEKPWFNVTSIRSECNSTNHLDDTSLQDSDLPKDSRPRPHPDYLGVYVNSAFGNVIVSFDGVKNSLRLAMGRFLTADLHYSRSDDTFYAAHDGVIWFRKERIPVRFRNSLAGGGIDVLEMPLGALKETRHMVSFAKANGKQVPHGHTVQTTVNAGQENCVCAHPDTSSAAAAAAATVARGRNFVVNFSAMLNWLFLFGLMRISDRMLSFDV